MNEKKMCTQMTANQKMFSVNFATPLIKERFFILQGFSHSWIKKITYKYYYLVYYSITQFYLYFILNFT